MLNSVIIGKPGNIFDQVVTSPQDQRDVMVRYLLPVKHKILGMVDGNHEYRIYQAVGVDLSKDIARALNVPYQPDGMALKIKFGHGNNSMAGKPFVYYGYFTHGYGGARTNGAKDVKGERLAYFLSCDFYTMAHDHSASAHPYATLNCDNREWTDPETGFTSCAVKARRAVIVKSNAYIKWGGYGQRGGFPPTDLMTPIIKLSGHRVDDDFELGAYPMARALI